MVREIFGLLLMSALLPGVATQGNSQSAADDEGFISIFNGTDLSGWDGDPRFWSVRDGVLRGQTTAETPAETNTFCIWRGGTLRDFMLKIKFRINGGNSGIQYRSKEFGRWRISGYQAEVCSQPGQVGFLYHEAGRGSLVQLGDFGMIDAQGAISVIGKVADANELQRAGYYKAGDWNEYLLSLIHI